MKIKIIPQEEIRTQGLKTLSKTLGPHNLVRFLQQYKTGRGDYTKERHAHLDELSIDEIVGEIKSQRNLTKKRLGF